MLCKPVGCIAVFFAQDCQIPTFRKGIVPDLNHRRGNIQRLHLFAFFKCFLPDLQQAIGQVYLLQPDTAFKRMRAEAY